MKNRSIKTFAFAALVSSSLLVSCKKEEAIAPDSQSETILFIKAVRTDSTVLESERVLLR